jgi:hypothetical protein
MRTVPKVATCTIARNYGLNQTETVLVRQIRLLTGTQKEQLQP